MGESLSHSTEGWVRRKGEVRKEKRKEKRREEGRGGRDRIVLPSKLPYNPETKELIPWGGKELSGPRSSTKVTSVPTY